VTGGASSTPATGEAAYADPGCSVVGLGFHFDRDLVFQD